MKDKSQMSGQMSGKMSGPRPGGAEPNAQNSELSPNAHPSGRHTEQMYNNAQRAANEEHLRPSERVLDGSHRHHAEQISPEDPAEGARDASTEAPHRMDADDRTSR